MKFNYTKKIDIFFILLFFFFILYLLNLIVLYKNFDSLNTSGYLLINYDGGFIRRALLGEVVTKISLFFQLTPPSVLIFFYTLNYVLFFYLNYTFLKNYKKNYIFYFFIFSPIYLTFPLSDISSKYAEFVISREIFLITFFMFFCFLCKKINNRVGVYTFGIILMIISTFIYELTILCYPFYFYAYYIYLKKRNLPFNIYEFIFAGFLFSLIIFFHLYFYGKNDFQVVINNLNLNFGYDFSVEQFIFSWLNQDINKQLVIFFPDFKTSYILKYLFYAHPIFLLLIMSYKSINDKIVFTLLVFSIISFLIVFLIAIDWARFVHILYCLTLYSIILLNFDKDKFFILNSKKKYFIKLNHKYLDFFVLIYCSIWTLKHTYWQNHLSYGIFYVFKKNFLYFY